MLKVVQESELQVLSLVLEGDKGLNHLSSSK